MKVVASQVAVASNTYFVCEVYAKFNDATDLALVVAGWGPCD
jgi:hypothetical protein